MGTVTELTLPSEQVGKAALDRQTLSEHHCGYAARKYIENKEE